MKKKRTATQVPDDEVLPYYDLRGARRSPNIDENSGLVVCSSVLIDGDVVDWFRMRSPTPEAYINAVLRLHMEANRRAGEAPRSPRATTRAARTRRATAQSKSAAGELQRAVQLGLEQLNRGEAVDGATVFRRLRKKHRRRPSA